MTALWKVKSWCAEWALAATLASWAPEAAVRLRLPGLTLHLVDGYQRPGLLPSPNEFPPGK